MEAVFYVVNILLNIHALIFLPQIIIGYYDHIVNRRQSECLYVYGIGLLNSVVCKLRQICFV